MGRGLKFTIDGKSTEKACNAIICFLPTGMYVTGLDMEGVPHCNVLERSHMTQILGLSECLLDDDGVLVIVSSKDASLQLLQSAPTYKLRHSHTVGLFCRHPYAIVEDREVIILTKGIIIILILTIL